MYSFKYPFILYFSLSFSISFSSFKPLKERNSLKDKGNTSASTCLPESKVAYSSDKSF